MSNPILLKRLKSEFIEIDKYFAKTPYIFVLPNDKEPPDEYIVIYKANGVGKRDGQWIKVNKHIVHIYLSHNFFEVGPTATFKTPHYHPNIYPNSNKFCAFASSFRAGESLTEYILRLGEVLQFKTYNLDSPANKEAAKWAKQSPHMFPLDKRNLRKRSFFPMNRIKRLFKSFNSYH